jgi:hypothetical protein
VAEHAHRRRERLGEALFKLPSDGAGAGTCDLGHTSDPPPPKVSGFVGPWGPGTRGDDMRAPRGVMVGVLMAVVAAWLGAGTAGAAPVQGLEGVPHYDHVVVLTLENESAATTFAPGSPATFLNSLRGQGVFVPNYYGTSHVSLPNYLAMVSGQLANGLTNTDCAAVSLYVCAFTTGYSFAGGRHLGDQLDGSALSWKAYLDGAPTACFHGPYSTSLTDLLTPDPFQGNSQALPAKDYADRHNPFVYFTDVVGNATRCAAHERPYTDLPGDLMLNTLPAFAFITPDTCHDGHDSPCSNGAPGGLVSADSWLSSNVPNLLTYLQGHNGLLIINFDEGGLGVPSGVPSLTDYLCFTCASFGLGGRTGAIFIGPGLTAGKTSTASYDHYSLLRTIEDSFGISEHLNMATYATPMLDVFAH